LIYLLAYVALLLCGIVSRKNASLRNGLYYICLVGLFLFAGFRYKVGCDWSAYLLIFDESRSNAPGRVELAFTYINKILHYFEFDYPYINVIAAVIFFAGLHTLAKRQPDPLGVLILAFPILILELAMSGIRQAIAVGFLCFAYNAFVDKRPVRFILFVIIATSFHSSAMVYLILAPFVGGELSVRRTALGGALALPGVYFFLTSETFETYSHRYIGHGTEAAGAPFRTGLLAVTGIAFLWFLDREWRATSVRDYKLVKMSSYLMLVTFPLSIYSSVVGDRIGFYLYPIQLMVLARLPFLVPSHYSMALALTPYAVGALFLMTWTQLSFLFEQCYLPYQFWW
jgi:hypothetical protein